MCVCLPLCCSAGLSAETDEHGRTDGQPREAWAGERGREGGGQSAAEGVAVAQPAVGSLPYCCSVGMCSEAGPIVATIFVSGGFPCFFHTAPPGAAAAAKPR